MNWVNQISVNSLIRAGVWFGVSLVWFKLLQAVLIGYFRKLAKRTSTDIDDLAIEIIGKIRPQFYVFLAFYIGVQFINLGEVVASLLRGVLVVWVVYYVVIALQILIVDKVSKAVAKDKDESTQQALGIISSLVKGVLWGVGALFVLSNFGVNVTSVIAGLGIGGLALALAVKDILGDLLSSIAIFLDKPFKVGDTIEVDGSKGEVKQIGIKTTRLKGEAGKEIVVPNEMLTSKKVQVEKR